MCLLSYYYTPETPSCREREGLQKNWLRVANWAVIPYWWRGPNNRYADDAAKFRIRKLAWKYYLRGWGARVFERRHQKATQITQIAIGPEAKRATSHMPQQHALSSSNSPRTNNDFLLRVTWCDAAEILTAIWEYTHNRPPFDFANWKLRLALLKLSYQSF
jgi:hypothetical protein